MSSRIARLHAGTKTEPVSSTPPRPRSRKATSRPSSSSSFNVDDSATLRRKKSSIIPAQPSSARSSSNQTRTCKSRSGNTKRLIVGQRVSVASLGIVGTLRFVGETKFKPDIWTGIELDLVGSGKNDGSVQGIRYFSCPACTGLFVPASKVVPVDTTPKPSKTMEVRRKRSSPEITSKPTETKRKHSSLDVALKPSKTIETKHRSSPDIAPKSSRTVTSRRKTSVPSSTPPVASRQVLMSKSARTSRMTQVPTEAVAKQRRSKSSVTVAPSKTITRALKQSNPSTPAPRKSIIRKEPTLRRSTSTRTIKSEDELQRMHVLLEQSRKEKEILSEQMDGKEAAWERLVSAKESYALRVKELNDTITRLQQGLNCAEQKIETLEQALVEKDETLARTVMGDVMERQYVQRIEKLDSLVRELQTGADKAAESHEAKLREHAAQVEQLRRELTERDRLTDALERECEELRKAGMDTIRAYETSMLEATHQKDHVIQGKQHQIDSLQHELEDLRSCDVARREHNEEYDDDDGGYRNSQRRLEEQLELTTRELDRERVQMKHMGSEIDQLREEIKRMHLASASAEDRYCALQCELEQEIKDKRRIMEEANAASEALIKAEDENEQLRLADSAAERKLAEAIKKASVLERKLLKDSRQQQQQDEHVDCVRSKRSLEEEHEELRQSHNRLEQECMRLMDELLALESAQANEEPGDQKSEECALRRQVERLKQELTRQQQKYTDLELSKRTKVTQLNKELAELEALTESKIFGAEELEESLQAERRRVKHLEKELADQNRIGHRYSMPMTPISPVSMSSFSHCIDSSADGDHHPLDEDDVYCEICEVYGHDVMGCTALMIMNSHELKDPLEDQPMPYCVNCDVFGVHPTEDCPNQDETF
ncbi:hypothetical protein DFQ28_008625 [Apophysomyces sp. BC1034]|nr:hypothetical protein DFQ30_008352 [Apophysomyces sp. BC1015]KAG0174813.1 hypothetical protein DFQ29_007355 [Apophysomyces sp. BC1021]KAG0185887.1 hypothetical protein DFQ28_008625 [Apophysomyces sp. BC1034]